MLTIRLSRTGKRHKPLYRIVLQEKTRDPWSPAIEILGNYNPHTQPSTVELNEERVKYWLEKGAAPSETVHNMLVSNGILKAEKVSTVTITKKRAAKLEDKKAAKEEAKKAAEEAKKAEAEAAKVAAEEAKKAEEEAKKAEEEAAAEKKEETEVATEEKAEESTEAPAEEAPTEEATEEKKEA